MFGLSQLQERLIFAGIFVLLLVGFALYERHQGALRCLRDDEKAVAVQVAKNHETYVAGVTTVFQEASTYDAAIHAPIERPVSARLCKPSHSGPVPASTASGPTGNAGPDVRAADSGDSVPGADVGPELLAVGRDANAHVTALESYIRDVCPVRR
jgi:hypothetical protein